MIRNCDRVFHVIHNGGYSDMATSLSYQSVAVVTPQKYNQFLS